MLILLRFSILKITADVANVTIYMRIDLVIARFLNLLFGVILSKVEDTFFFNSSPCKP
jgi:hypothetical protein